jgi:hypothetical protein
MTALNNALGKIGNRRAEPKKGEKQGRRHVTPIHYYDSHVTPY